MKSGIKIGTRAKLVKKLLIVEGITRAGKFLLANLLKGFEDVEPVQYYGLLENIPFLEQFGLIDRKTAQEILHCEIDTHAYEMLIGRNLNHRKSDKSSVYNTLDPQEYLRRADEPDGDAALAKFRKRKPYSFFIAHELMPFISLYFNTFPEMKLISLRRSPMDLVYSWYRRGHGRRWGNDPKIFQIVFGGPRGPLPWFATGWPENYYELGEMDRIIGSLETIIRRGEKSRRRLSPARKRRILFIKYEDILAQPQEVVDAIGKFLNLKKRRQLSLILKKEKLPAVIDRKVRLAKEREIKNLASDKFFKKLIKLEKEYHEK